MDSFDWDLNKEAQNIRKHRIDFTTASLIWEGPAIERVDDRRDYGETRIVATGEISGRLAVVVYTWRGTVRRIISARKANSREKMRYEAAILKRHRAAQG